MGQGERGGGSGEWGIGVGVGRDGQAMGRGERGRGGLGRGGGVDGRARVALGGLGREEKETRLFNGIHLTRESENPEDTAVRVLEGWVRGRTEETRKLGEEVELVYIATGGRDDAGLQREAKEAKTRALLDRFIQGCAEAQGQESDMERVKMNLQAQGKMTVEGWTPKTARDLPVSEDVKVDNDAKESQGLPRMVPVQFRNLGVGEGEGVGCFPHLEGGGKEDSPELLQCAVGERGDYTYWQRASPQHARRKGEHGAVLNLECQVESGGRSG